MTSDIKKSELEPFFRDHELFAEYKLLCNNVPSGVYVVPSLKSLQVWHGMIFIKIGMFAEGCFKFNLYIPDNFPYARPTLQFITPVFHPQIKETGELNLAKAFPTWTPRKDRIWHILRYTKRCFFSVNTFNPANPVAAETVHKSIDLFRKQAKLCVERSIKLLDRDGEEDVTSADDGNVFNVKPLPDKELEKLKNKVLATSANTGYTDMFI